jgi:hypothetical protein
MRVSAAASSSGMKMWPQQHFIFSRKSGGSAPRVRMRFSRMEGFSGLSIPPAGARQEATVVGGQIRSPSGAWMWGVMMRCFSS